MLRDDNKICVTTYFKRHRSRERKTPPKLIKLSNEYAFDILEQKKFSPWLYVCDAIAQTFKDGWIPDDYYGKIVVPKLKGNYGDISNYNALTKRLFKSEFFPDLLYFANGLWISPDYQVLSEKQVGEIAFSESDKVVYKIVSDFKFWLT